MALTPGTRLRDYEVIGPLGSGGMGEVFRARDTKLHRDVAIKTLPALFAGNSERVARFEREAQLLAALNHPNIGAIYGFEEAPSGRYLVLEFVDGESLAARIARAAPGGLPLDDALRIALQIADALEAAHDKGIIHRDLKPANVMLTADGQVKVLDFGLARALEADATVNVSNSPTLSLAATQAGVILGTAAYMSPEQAKGRPADKRSDVWAFGCVVYEMLTGRRAFDGEDLSETLASILRNEPDWTAIPADVPHHIRDIVRRCVQRDRRARIPDFSVIRYLMTEPAVSQAPAAAPPPASGRRGTAIAVLSFAAGMALAGVAWWAYARTQPEAAVQPMRFAIVPASSQSLLYSPVDRTLAISPDGTHLVYMGRGTPGGDSVLLLRRIDQLQPTVVAGTDAARYPFFSPDGRWIGFFQTGELRKVAITGGPPTTLCRLTGGTRGAVWTRDNTIIFASADPSTGLQVVSAEGGEPKALTRPAAGEDHYHPALLPDHRAVLFTAIRGGVSDSGEIKLIAVDTGKQRTLLRGASHPEYVHTGHLLHVVAGTLRAVRFDPERRETIGDAIPVESGILTLTASGVGNYSTSRDGHLVFVPGSESSSRRTLVWVYRDGREEPIDVEPRTYTYARISPEGGRLALDLRGQEQDVWVMDLARGIPSRVTFDPGIDGIPVWTPNGQNVIYTSGRAGPLNLFTQPADGTGVVERLTTAPVLQTPNAVTPDGKQLVIVEVRPDTGADIVALDLAGKSTPRTLVGTPYGEGNADLSRDGRWLAYQTNETGQPQIIVRPFPDVEAGRWQVSSAGGTRPAWSRTGGELFYLSPAGAMMSVKYDADPVFRPGRPAKLFDTRYYTGLLQRSYDVAPDGRRFLMIKETDVDQGGASPGMVIVLNWAEELKAKLPRD